MSTSSFRSSFSNFKEPTLGKAFKLQTPSGVKLEASDPDPPQWTHLLAAAVTMGRELSRLRGVSIGFPKTLFLPGLSSSGVSNLIWSKTSSRTILILTVPTGQATTL